MPLETGLAAIVNRGAASQLPRRRVVVLAISAVAFAFALAVLPNLHARSPQIDVAALLAVGVVVLAATWRPEAAAARIGLPLAYVAMVPFLIDAGGGTGSGLGGLFLLPLLWLAIAGSRRELLLGFAAVAVARGLPIRLIGAPAFPSSDWQTAIVLGAVAVVACVTIQHLVREARLQAEHLAEAARQLAEQNDELRKLDDVKDGFLALVSHELRTPLTSVMGYLEMLQEENADPLTLAQQQFLGTVGRNVDRLATLVDDLLFLVQADAGRLELTLARTDLERLLIEATEAARPAASAKAIELTLDAGTLAPALCDAGRIAQLIDNLVANAVKFTPSGGRVSVTANQRGSTIELSVSDTGIGIAPDELPRLFDRFFRASSATTNAIPGTGLGLAISQAIAEAHDSTITVDSTLARGTTFRLRLAADPAASADARPTRRPASVPSAATV